MRGVAVSVSTARPMCDPEPVAGFTMSLVAGWDQIPPERGGRLPAAGDLIVLEVRKPAPPVSALADWTLLGEIPWTDEDGTERMGTVFWKIIGPRETDPAFYAEGAEEWDVHGYAITGVAPLDDEGSGVPWQQN